jgi:anti-anti-sigma factor
MSTDPPYEPFSCATVRDGRSVRVTPHGELELASAGEVVAQADVARREGLDELVLDLREVTFMDSTGLRIVVGLHRQAGDDGFAFAVIPGPPEVQRVFELTGLLDALPFRHP